MREAAVRELEDEEAATMFFSIFWLADDFLFLQIMLQ